MKASEQLTKSGLFSVTIVSSPTEGIIISGEEEMCLTARKLLENTSLAKVVEEAPTKAGWMINHFSTRAEKEKALKTLFKCNLPPLPMPLSELKTFTLLAAVFGKVWEVEMLKNKYKMGDPVPDNVREWFEDDVEVFQNLRGATHTGKLGNLLKERGTTITQLYRKMVTAAYTKRLGGEEHLESYHLERDLNEINGLNSEEGGNVGADAIPEEEAGEKENEKDGEAHTQRKCIF